MRYSTEIYFKGTKTHHILSATADLLSFGKCFEGAEAMPRLSVSNRQNQLSNMTYLLRSVGGCAVIPRCFNTGAGTP